MQRFTGRVGRSFANCHVCIANYFTGNNRKNSTFLTVRKRGSVTLLPQKSHPRSEENDQWRETTKSLRAGSPETPRSCQEAQGKMGRATHRCEVSSRRFSENVCGRTQTRSTMERTISDQRDNGARDGTTGRYSTSQAGKMP